MTNNSIPADSPETSPAELEVKTTYRLLHNQTNDMGNKDTPSQPSKEDNWNDSRVTSTTERGSGDDDYDDYDDEPNNTDQESRPHSTSKDGEESTFQYDNRLVKWFKTFRHICGVLVESPQFQGFIITLIIINALIMGVATFEFVAEEKNIQEGFDVVDKIFLILFTVECFMQFVHRGVFLFTDRWLVFDFLIVVLSWSLESLQIIRAFRVFRALRLVTRITILRNLITALMNVLPRMSAIICLLSLVVYIFAVMFTVLFKEVSKAGLLGEGYFSSLDASLFTLLQVVTLDWVAVARPCMDIYWWAWLPFVAFVNMTSFIVYNLFIAVVCDAVKAAESENNPLKDGASSTAGSQNPLIEEEDEIEVPQRRIRQVEIRLQEISERQRYILEILQEVVDDMKEEDSQLPVKRITFPERRISC
mmetsp:Transcript_28579/g.43933  ORF Transcript_28579/g.43933 Transcript_28579/m.43933 type:complete len:420 (-) Transcript_28579:66-1325(-)|eukprot:CAMPEP_0118681210 /NCGR_PEP_ID=MMETSP0800-20121206/4810_1 /TAXON_ID=210618 ORGANISM="Striatella unipunctata, Strain CCMP2910" /NCGR_SAMPLE_ID=MMETSP0800 /ASSEMBLY_ACC=CAM_ASM_000638 /LENGTH=419 /DNA_ID=CAMNT_0006577477 /DNA_START=118 /DNA_END=1374 /DNA_ORIENTATION=-